MNNNFKWLVDDMYSNIILKVFSSDENEKSSVNTYEIIDVLDTTGRELDIKFANIDDISSLLTMGIVRFGCITNRSNIIDVPFRKMYMLLENAYFLSDRDTYGKEVNFEELDGFSLVDVKCIETYALGDISDDLLKMIMIAKEYGNLGMQEKFDALTEANDINYKRIKEDNLNRRY